MPNEDDRQEAIDAEEQETLADKLQAEFHADVLAGAYDCDCTACQEKRDRTRHNPNQITMEISNVNR